MAIRSECNRIEIAIRTIEFTRVRLEGRWLGTGPAI